MVKHRHTRRHRSRRRYGGLALSTEQENKFLSDKKKERERELGKVGDLIHKGPKVVESEGMGTRKPKSANYNVDSFVAHSVAKGGRTRRRHRRKTSRR